MSTASPPNHELARRLLAFEAARDNSSEARAEVAVRVIEELRVRLIRLAGVEGFRALLSRALTLAKADAPLLQPVQVRADGALEGLAGIEQSAGGAAAAQAGTALVARLLALLIVFIGEPLTLRLVQDAWPDASLDGANSRTEEQL